MKGLNFTHLKFFKLQRQAKFKMKIEIAHSKKKFDRGKSLFWIGSGPDLLSLKQSVNNNYWWDCRHFKHLGLCIYYTNWDSPCFGRKVPNRVNNFKTFPGMCVICAKLLIKNLLWTKSEFMYQQTPHQGPHLQVDPGGLYGKMWSIIMMVF